MAGFVDSVEVNILDHFCSDPPWTPPTTMYLAISTTTPTDAGANFTEPVGNAYVRVSIVAADWAPATAGGVGYPATKVNSATKAFPAATGSWGTVTHYGLFDALTVGNLLGWGLLAASKTIVNGDVASFQPGDIVLKHGDSGDNYA